MSGSVLMGFGGIPAQGFFSALYSALADMKLLPAAGKKAPAS